MIINFTLAGTVEVPDGSELVGPRTIRLPDGQYIKLWTSVELNEERDLDYKEMMALDIDLEEVSAELEVSED